MKLIVIFSNVLMNTTNGHTPHCHVRRRLVTRSKKIQDKWIKKGERVDIENAHCTRLRPKEKFYPYSEVNGWEEWWGGGGGGGWGIVHKFLFPVKSLNWLRVCLPLVQSLTSRCHQTLKYTNWKLDYILILWNTFKAKIQNFISLDFLNSATKCCILFECLWLFLVFCVSFADEDESS